MKSSTLRTLRSVCVCDSTEQRQHEPMASKDNFLICRLLYLFKAYNMLEYIILLQDVCNTHTLCMQFQYHVYHQQKKNTLGSNVTGTM